MKSERISTPKRPSLLGPGTVLALVAAIGIVAYGWLSDRPTPAPNAGLTMYESDAGGKMRRGDAPSIAPSTPPKLRKPEVGWLLQHTSELRLDKRQKQKIETLNTIWQQEKTALEEAMRRAVSEADGKRKEAEVYHSASASQITDSLGDYSRLSHQYNDRRASYWSQALATLTPEQNSTLERMATTDRKENSL